MTNTKFRRRALLSSVAMLLVALVALGSATFAWFTSSTSASANGIMISTTKSSELKIAKKDLVWADSVTYDGFASNYVPTSSVTGTTWYTSVANAKDAYTSNGTYATAESLSGVVYDEMLNIKNVGGKAANNVTITLGGSIPSNFGRIAIVKCGTAQTTANTPAAITDATFKSSIYANSDDSWKPYNGSGVEGTAWTASTYTGTISVGTLAVNEVASYRILVWFEGEDSDCYDLTTSSLNIGTGASKIGFTVSAS